MFSKEFTTAIESKQVAQQDAERQKYIVLKSEQEMQAAIIRAEGEGAAADLISSVRARARGGAREWPRPRTHTPPPVRPPPQALKEHGVGAIEVKRIDALREIAETLSKSRNVVYVPGKGNMMMALPAARPAMA